MHGTRGTTGSEGCLLLYSGVGKSLIFPMTFLCVTCQIRCQCWTGCGPRRTARCPAWHGPSPCAPCHTAPRVPKFEAGKPGGGSVSALLHSRTLTQFFFRAIRAASPGVRLCVPTLSRSFQGVQCCAALRSLSFPDKPKGWYAAEVLWK